MPGRVLDFDEFRLRRHLKRKLGDCYYHQAFRLISSKALRELFRYAPQSRLVYIEPDFFGSILKTGDGDLLEKVSLFLAALQDSPLEIRALLSQDPSAESCLARE